MANPLGSRLGVDFFKSIPTTPGVYFFYDDTGRLLYIGQSNDLRARIGSYRHVSPEQHPNRILRLVHRIARVEWRECLTAKDAIDLERELLLEHRPPHNRAGIWAGSPWWCSAEARGEILQVRLSRHQLQSSTFTGPLPASFRYVHASLLRCTYRLLRPDLKLFSYPLGMLNCTIPLLIQIKTPDAVLFARYLTEFIQDTENDFIERLESLPSSSSPIEAEFWNTEIDLLKKYSAKKKIVRVPEIAPQTVELSLFPELG